MKLTELKLIIDMLDPDCDVLVVPPEEKKNKIGFSDSESAAKTKEEDDEKYKIYKAIIGKKGS